MYRTARVPQRMRGSAGDEEAAHGTGPLQHRAMGRARRQGHRGCAAEVHSGKHAERRQRWRRSGGERGTPCVPRHALCGVCGGGGGGGLVLSTVHRPSLSNTLTVYVLPHAPALSGSPSVALPSGTRALEAVGGREGRARSAGHGTACATAGGGGGGGTVHGTVCLRALGGGGGVGIGDITSKRGCQIKRRRGQHTPPLCGSHYLRSIPQGMILDVQPLIKIIILPDKTIPQWIF